MASRMKTMVMATLSGALFGAGLVISGMSDPNKVLNFLDVLGPWDPSLLFVMGAATVVTFVGYRLCFRQAAPVCDTAFHLPEKRGVDLPLVGGAALFGLGWGLAGYCPGPALTALVINPAEALWFVGAMLLGMALQRRFARRAPAKTANP